MANTPRGRPLPLGRAIPGSQPSVTPNPVSGPGNPPPLGSGSTAGGGSTNPPQGPPMHVAAAQAAAAGVWAKPWWAVVAAVIFMGLALLCAGVPEILAIVIILAIVVVAAVVGAFAFIGKGTKKAASVAKGAAGATKGGMSYPTDMFLRPATVRTGKVLTPPGETPVMVNMVTASSGNASGFHPGGMFRFGNYALAVPQISEHEVTIDHGAREVSIIAKVNPGGEEHSIEIRLKAVRVQGAAQAAITPETCIKLLTSRDGTWKDILSAIAQSVIQQAVAGYSADQLQPSHFAAINAAAQPLLNAELDAMGLEGTFMIHSIQNSALAQASETKRVIDATGANPTAVVIADALAKGLGAFAGRGGGNSGGSN